MLPQCARLGTTCPLNWAWGAAGTTAAPGIIKHFWFRRCLCCSFFTWVLICFSKVELARTGRVEGPSNKIPSREIMHCCFTNPPSARCHINLGCLTKVLCSYLGIIFTRVNPGLAFPQLGIPLFYLKSQSEVLIPLLTPKNSSAFLCGPCCCWKLVLSLCLRQGQLSIEQIPESKLQILTSSYHKLPASTQSRGRRHWHLLAECIMGKWLTSHCLRNSALGYTQHDTLGFALLHGPLGT